MSKNKQKPLKTDMEYKKSLKRVWITLGCLLPIIILTSYAFGVLLKLPEWLVVFMNVVFGGFVCLIIYFVFDKLDARKKRKELLEDNKDKYDPFKD